MPRKFIKYYQPSNIFVCAKCNTHIATLSDLASKTKHPVDQTAYIFTKVINVRQSKPETKKLLTGVAQVVDLYCHGCYNHQIRGCDQQQINQCQPIGWKYISVGITINTSDKSENNKDMIILEQQNQVQLAMRTQALTQKYNGQGSKLFDQKMGFKVGLNILQKNNLRKIQWVGQ